MIISEDGLKKLKLREGLRLVAYQDRAGVWTIGYGHTPAKKGQVITKEEAGLLLEEDLHRFHDVINQNVRVHLSQHQFDALVSFAFNVGVYAFQTSTLLRLLNKGHYIEVPQQLLRWNKVTVDGTKVKDHGLIYRRVAECAQWFGNRIGLEYD